MAKKNIHHSVHFSEEVQKMAEANMKRGRYKSLNAYVEGLIRRHDELLRACQTSAEIADKWRKLLQILEEEK